MARLLTLQVGAASRRGRLGAWPASGRHALNQLLPPAASPCHAALAFPPLPTCSRVVATIGTYTRFHADFSGGEERGAGFIY